MDVRNLDRAQPRDASPFAVGLNFQYEPYSLADAVVHTRAIRMLESKAPLYPIHRKLRCASRRGLAEIFDDLALHMMPGALRLDEAALLLDGPGVFIEADGTRKRGYCSCKFGIWAESVALFDEIRTRILHIIGDVYAREDIFTIDWYFSDSYGRLEHASFDELAGETLYDEAYPALGMPVADFIARYLDADETVLVLQGAPGTGKTRLVRAVLAAMSARKRDSAQVMYTGDCQVFEKDEIFAKFITGSHDAFVIEDADHRLLARSSGNHDLHRFLAIADGVVRAQGRKIIFTTNLPNVADIDEALLRPGRCFANVRTRALLPAEATCLIARLAPAARDAERLLTVAVSKSGKGATLSELYQVCNHA
jgi:hypothetical protein